MLIGKLKANGGVGSQKLTRNGKSILLKYIKLDLI